MYPPLRLTLLRVTPLFDYYVDPAAGNDSNPGTAAAPWQTASKLVGVVNALPAGAVRSAYLRPGTYGSINFAPTNTVAVRVSAAPGLLIDTTASNTDNGFGSSNTATAELRCEGAAEIRVSQTNGANTPNAISAANSAQVFVYGSEASRLLVSQAADGISGHNSSSIYCYRVRAENCDKGCLVPDTNTSTATLDDCELVGRAAGMSAGIVSWGSSGALVLNRTKLIPTANGQLVNFGPNHTLTRCEVGTESLRVTQSITAGHVGTYSRCFLNAGLDAHGSFAYDLCYGRITMRVRGNPTVADMTMRRCVWVGPPSGLSTGFLYANADTSPPSFDGIGYDVRDCVIRGYTTAVGGGFSANQITRFNENSRVDYCCLHTNTTNFAAGVTGTSTAGRVTSDPLIGAANTTSQADYAVANNSPCVGAGSTGGNIGFTAADVAA